MNTDPINQFTPRDLGTVQLTTLRVFSTSSNTSTARLWCTWSGFNDRLQINLLLPLLVARTSYCVIQSLLFNKVLAKDVKKRRKDEKKKRRDTMMPDLPAMRISSPSQVTRIMIMVRLANTLNSTRVVEQKKRNRTPFGAEEVR